MFTGLIEEIGTVQSVKKSGEGVNIEISCGRVLEGTAIGDSISINGACQTVTGMGNGVFIVYASRVTCDTTTLGMMKPGRRVNLERAMETGSRFGGHIVQGHIDGKGKIKGIQRDSGGIEVIVETGSGLLKYMAAKGSVAVDGISLTIVSMTASDFSLYLIPETLGSTTVSMWEKGDEVNLEVDILAKYVERMLAPDDGPSTDNETMEKKLLEEGFI